MEPFQAFLVWLKGEGKVIFEAPYLFAISVCIAALAVNRTLSWFHQKTKEDKDSTIKNLESTVKLAEKERDLYKAEAANYQSELAKLKTNVKEVQALPVIYGNEAVKNVFVRVSSAPLETYSFTIFGDRKNWSDDELGSYVASTRLQELGLAKIKVEEIGTSVAPTTAAIGLRAIVEEDEKKKK